MTTSGSLDGGLGIIAGARRAEAVWRIRVTGGLDNVVRAAEVL